MSFHLCGAAIIFINNMQGRQKDWTRNQNSLSLESYTVRRVELWVSKCGCLSRVEILDDYLEVIFKFLGRMTREGEND